MAGNAVLSRDDLEQFDPSGGRGRGAEQRYCCPLCGHEKPKDASHRSLSLSPLDGLWKCYRCGAGGQLRDNWVKRDRPTRRREKRARAFGIPKKQAEAAVDPDKLRRLQQELQGTALLLGSPGEQYLQERGIPVELALQARARFHPAWFGRPAVLFPVRDQTGKLVAAQGRYTDGQDNPKTRSAGSVSRGVFTTLGALEADRLAVVEAPIDALSLAAAGLPAVALIGTGNRPDWLPKALAFRTVLLATDNDPPTERHPKGAGNEAAEALAEWFTPLGTRCYRLRPVDAAKDWNEVLCTLGQDDLAELLRAALAPLTTVDVGDRPACKWCHREVGQANAEEVQDGEWQCLDGEDCTQATRVRCAAIS